MPGRGRRAACSPSRAWSSRILLANLDPRATRAARMATAALCPAGALGHALLERAPRCVRVTLRERTGPPLAWARIRAMTAASSPALGRLGPPDPWPAFAARPRLPPRDRRRQPAGDRPRLRAARRRDGPVPRVGRRDPRSGMGRRPLDRTARLAHRAPGRRHPQRHVRQHRRADHRVLRPPGRTHRGRQGVDHRLDHRQPAARPRRQRPRRRAPPRDRRPSASGSPGSNAALLVVAAIGLFVPAIFAFSSDPGQGTRTEESVLVPLP